MGIFSFCLYWTKYILVHKPTELFVRWVGVILFLFLDLKIVKRTKIMTQYDASYPCKTLVKLMHHDACYDDYDVFMTFYDVMTRHRCVIGAS